MPQTKKRNEELLERANSLPICPGVYIMKDKNQNIIYVGKSRKLKNRVSQYFQQSKKNDKTFKMVNAAEDFDYILCKTEIEALTLENTLIKQYAPKYNIRLKDAKSYPYIKISAGEYPQIVFTRTRASDKGKYYGPFSGSSIAYSVLDILHKSLGIPNCKKSFPREIGKGRPCLYYQMGQCCGLCTGNVSKDEYASLIACAADILRGNISSSKKMLEIQMMKFAEDEKFEAASKCRDTIRALERLNEKQSVVASPDINADIFGFYGDEAVSCISVIYIRNGIVTDKTDFLLNGGAILDEEGLASFVAEHYINRDNIPQTIQLSFSLTDEDNEMLEEFLGQKNERRVYIHTPQKGIFKELVSAAVKNAEEKARQAKLNAQKDEEVLIKLATLLQLESVPERIEAYDISNIGTENITAGMVVFQNAKPLKSDYRLFNIKSVKGSTDDYMSVREAIERRIRRLKEGDGASFSSYPDLLLIDGGKGHVSVVKEVLTEQGVNIPVFGMVKDDFHKTRALCTENEEINIAKERAIFMLIYGIQEEVHRFIVGKTNASKRSTLRHSVLEKIDGIGPAKAKLLLRYFGGAAAIKRASVEELLKVKGISQKNAENIRAYFTQRKET